MNETTILDNEHGEVNIRLSRTKGKVTMDVQTLGTYGSLTMTFQEAHDMAVLLRDYVERHQEAK